MDKSLTLAILSLLLLPLSSPKGADLFPPKAIVVPPPPPALVFRYPAGADTNNRPWQLEASPDGLHWGVVSDYTVSNRVVTVRAKGDSLQLYRVVLVANN